MPWITINGSHVLVGEDKQHGAAHGQPRQHPLASANAHQAHYDIHNEATGYSRGTTYGRISATDEAGNRAGKLDYAAGYYRNDIHMVEVAKQHQGHGLASRMVDQLKKDFPHAKVGWGMTTPDGEKFKRAYYASKRKK